VKPFGFRLERVLGWRRTQLDLEEAHLKTMHAALAALDRERAELEQGRAEAGRNLICRSHVDGTDLLFLAGYRVAIDLQCERLTARRREEESAIVAQQQKLLEARRRCRLLENLRERQLEEWKRESERQAENEIVNSRNGPFRAR
jgi:flagellar export protein FliJ